MRCPDCSQGTEEAEEAEEESHVSSLTVLLMKSSQGNSQRQRSKAPGVDVEVERNQTNGTRDVDHRLPALDDVGSSLSSEFLVQEREPPLSTQPLEPPPPRDSDNGLGDLGDLGDLGYLHQS
jgi:hypothetical protein